MTTPAAETGSVGTETRERRSAPSLYPEADTTAGVGESLREQIARIIDPWAFKHWQSLYDYCQLSGDDDAAARKTAEWAHGKERDEALDKADRILALAALSPLDGGGFSALRPSASIPTEQTDTPGVEP